MHVCSWQIRKKAFRSFEQSASRITRLSQDISKYNEAHEGTVHEEKANYGIVGLGSTGFASECQIHFHPEVLFSSFCVVCERRQLSFKVSHWTGKTRRSMGVSKWDITMLWISLHFFSDLLLQAKRSCRKSVFCVSITNGIIKETRSPTYPVCNAVKYKWCLMRSTYMIFWAPEFHEFALGIPLISKRMPSNEFF